MTYKQCKETRIYVCFTVRISCLDWTYGLVNGVHEIVSVFVKMHALSQQQHPTVSIAIVSSAAMIYCDMIYIIIL